MKLKLVSALPAPVLDSLEDLIKPLYTKPGMRIIGVTEIAHVTKASSARPSTSPRRPMRWNARKPSTSAG